MYVYKGLTEPGKVMLGVNATIATEEVSHPKEGKWSMLKQRKR